MKKFMLSATLLLLIVGCEPVEPTDSETMERIEDEKIANSYISDFEAKKVVKFASAYTLNLQQLQERWGAREHVRTRIYHCVANNDKSILLVPYRDGNLNGDAILMYGSSALCAQDCNVDGRADLTSPLDASLRLRDGFVTHDEATRLVTQYESAVAANTRTDQTTQLVLPADALNYFTEAGASFIRLYRGIKDGESIIVIKAIDQQGNIMHNVQSIGIRRPDCPRNCDVL